MPTQIGQRPHDNELAQHRSVEQRASSMLAGYSHIGGVASGDEIVAILRPFGAQPLSRLARWIVAREIVQFQWRSVTLVPLFQFEMHVGSVRPVVAEALSELRFALDHWQVAEW